MCACDDTEDFLKGTASADGGIRKGAPSSRLIWPQNLVGKTEAGFQLPFFLRPPGQCVQDDVAVLVRTALMDSPKKTSRLCFGNWRVVS